MPLANAIAATLGVTRYSGADWLIQQRGKDAKPLSALGRCVADILGAAYAGLYHVPDRSIDRAQWDNEHVVIVTIGEEVATIDSSDLWTLAVLAQACGIRLAIRGAAPGHLRLQFTAGEGKMWFGATQPPNDMVARVLDRFGYVVADHGKVVPS